LDNHEGLRPDQLNSPEAADTPTPDEDLSVGQWLSRNGPMLLILAALGLFVHFYFNLDGTSWWSIAKAGLGLGLVIFIHELGHFLVAKWCDVHVQTFSIGFGPALPGCSFQWGETTYKLAVFPLGGYVQMVGQVDGHEENDGTEDDPRSYKNKSVWQRMAIISAGVTMNVILAIICFIVVFKGPGKDRMAAIVNSVDSGSPAYVKGLPTGAVITRIGNVDNPYFDDLMSIVMASQKGEQIPLTYQVGDKAPVTVEIEPLLNEEGGRPMIGIKTPVRLQLEARRFISPNLQHPAWPHTAASKAPSPFDFDDIIVATTDPDQPEVGYDPAKVTNLPLDLRNPGSGLRDYFAYDRRMQLLAGKELVVRVLRGPEGKQQTVDIKVPPAYHVTLGARMAMDQITAVREDSPGQRAGVQAHDVARSLNGDIIERVDLPEPQGKMTSYDKDKDLDPVRLPFQLRAWAQRWSRFAKKQGKAKVPEKMVVTLHVLRHSADRGPQDKRKVLNLSWDAAWRFDHEEASYPSSPQAIPELGIAYQVKTTVLDTRPTGAGNTVNPLQPGDVIKEVRLQYYNGVEDGVEKTKDGDWVKLAPDQWAWIVPHFDLSVKQISIKVERNKQEVEFTLRAAEDKDWPLAERGLALGSDWRREKADTLWGAVQLGFKDTKNTAIRVLQTLRGYFTGRLSVAKNLGGPVTIARVAFRFAGVDFWEFVFFLGMISVNLAVINFLPIPVLDGGHMVFLLYEKIRGKPASEQVRVGATYAGLLFLAAVMVFVLYIDIARLFKGG